MNKKFHCGRLVVNYDGQTKKLDLAHGGGTRDCPLTHVDMGFDEIHDRLRQLFSLDQTNHNSKLYDFKRKELDTNEYHTFLDYVTKNGLKFNGTLLYLCTSIDDDNNINYFHSPEKRKTTKTSPIQITQIKKKIAQVEADSSTSPAYIKIDDNSPSNHRSTNESVHNNRLSENIRISYSNYSFNKSLNELINYLRNLLIQYNNENILIQLFEYICTINGHSSIILDNLKQQIHLFNEQEKQFYNNGLDKIEKLSRTIKAFIELNKMKISYIDQYEIIKDLFNKFYQNFNILCDQWNTKINNNNNKEITVISSSDDRIESLSSTTFFSSSSRYYSQTNTRKHVRALSPPSVSQSTSFEENSSIFTPLLKSLDNLSDILYHVRYSSFHLFVQSLINEIKTFRLSFKLTEYRLLCDGEQFIKSIDIRLKKRLDDEYNRVSYYKINRYLQQPVDKTFESIQYLLTSFNYHQDLLNQPKRMKTTNWSSPPRQQYNDNRLHIKLDDDQSSDASHSSFGDDILMEVARDAYEQRPK